MAGVHETSTEDRRRDGATVSTVGVVVLDTHGFELTHRGVFRVAVLTIRDGQLNARNAQPIDLIVMRTGWATRFAWVDENGKIIGSSHLALARQLVRGETVSFPTEALSWTTRRWYDDEDQSTPRRPTWLPTFDSLWSLIGAWALGAVAGYMIFWLIREFWPWR